ncbi:MAG: hypothetical protein GF408_07935 [Candidatus Omnitrophica bacterium]|nr:hypothetical protein [Candidatus Omnitrophota bacterium]
MANKKKSTNTARGKKTKASPQKAVSGKRGFSKKELASVRNDLLTEKAKIIEEILSIQGQSNASFKDSSGDLSGYSFHMADMATDLYDREFALELAEGERERLFELDEAIKKIDEGLYGKCESCGGAIPKQRLKAVPQAKNCIKCQEEHERSANR